MLDSSLLILRLSNARRAFMLSETNSWAENFWRGVTENLELKVNQINNINTQKVRDENK